MLNKYEHIYRLYTSAPGLRKPEADFALASFRYEVFCFERKHKLNFWRIKYV